MSKDARNPVELTEEAKEKFEECVAAFAACGFGAEGPAKDTTFAEIEEFGHEVGRMVAGEERRVHELAQLLGRRRDVEVVDGVACLGGGEVMRLAADPADTRRDPGHLLDRTAHTEGLEPPQLGNQLHLSGSRSQCRGGDVYRF